jgi:hypothetical protein
MVCHAPRASDHRFILGFARTRGERGTREFE